jgi:hypothetical protein
MGRQLGLADELAAQAYAGCRSQLLKSRAFPHTGGQKCLNALQHLQLAAAASAGPAGDRQGSGGSEIAGIEQSLTRRDLDRDLGW